MNSCSMLTLQLTYNSMLSSLPALLLPQSRKGAKEGSKLKVFHW